MKEILKDLIIRVRELNIPDTDMIYITKQLEELKPQAPSFKGPETDTIKR
jgi:hypothetical protein